MSTFDIRKDVQEVIDSIEFADAHVQIKDLGDWDTYPQAYTIDKRHRFFECPVISDGGDQLFISSVDDAKNLIKALEKAIALDWWNAEKVEVKPVDD